MRRTSTSIGLTISAFAAGLLVAGSALAKEVNKADERVTIAQLTVKERILSMEQIDVTAEKPVTDLSEIDAEIAALLKEIEAAEHEETEESR